MMKRGLGILLSAAVTASLAATLSVAPARAQDATTLIVGFAQEPDNLNGYYSSMAFAQWAQDLLYANLWDYDNELNPVPVLIEEVPSIENGGISEDTLTYTLKLKEGLVWSDGEALNADDVVFTYQMVQSPDNNFQQASAIRDALVSVEKVDDLTVTLVFNTPQPFPENMAGATGLVGILPEHVYAPVFEADGSLEAADENQNPTVFSGPFTLTEWVRGESLTMTANPNFALGEPNIKTLVIRVFPDPQTAYAAMAAGQVDFVPNLAPNDPPIVEALSENIETIQVFGGYIEFLAMNMEPGDETGHPALEDVRVRQALRLGIDRRALVRDLLADATTVSESLYATTPYENTDLEFVEYDPEAAAALLDEAGWVDGDGDGIREKDGVKLELRYSTTTAQFRRDNQAVIQQQLAQIGVGIIIENYPASEFFGTFADNGVLAINDFDLGEYANNTTFTNIANVTVDEGLGCDQIVSEENPGGNNYPGYCNEELDTLYNVTATSSDPDEALESAQRIQEILYEELPVIVLYPRGDIYAYLSNRFVEAPEIGAGVSNQWYDIVNWQLQ
jgi:peptide/nickel transport system substrate-binding protein